MNQPRFPARRRFDPRYYQIGVLAVLLIYGITGLDLEIRPVTAAVMLAVAMTTQYVCGRIVGLPKFDPKSVLISGLSLCLLLRTSSLLLAALAAVTTIVAKFVIRWNGKHLFNPTNFGLVLMMLATDAVWVSPGQWGHVAYFAFFTACLGGLVVNRSERSDVTYAFFAFFAGLLVCRALWLGDPLRIPFHELQNGAFLIFTFFMISDPKTTPDSRAGRILFAALVAVLAYGIQYHLYRQNALLWSLAGVSLMTPVIDRLLPGGRYEWRSPATTLKNRPQGNVHETYPRSYADPILHHPVY